MRDTGRNWSVRESCFWPTPSNASQTAKKVLKLLNNEGFLGFQDSVGQSKECLCGNDKTTLNGSSILKELLRNPRSSPTSANLAIIRVPSDLAATALEQTGAQRKFLYPKGGRGCLPHKAASAPVAG